MLRAVDIDEFVERGHCHLPGAFGKRDAAEVCDRVWERMRIRAGIDRAEPSTWPPCYDIEERIDASTCFTDRLASAIDQLTGGAWSGRRAWGFWPVNFSYEGDRGLATPSTGWHVDGNWFRHTLIAPEQGLLLIGLFTDLAPGGGGTILAEGSHRQTARVLAGHHGGLGHLELFEHVLAEPIGGFHEVTGEAGDVILAHPFLFHTRGPKRLGPPRIVSNTEAPLRAPMQLDQATPSPLERSIAMALTTTDRPAPDAMRCWF